MKVRTVNPEVSFSEFFRNQELVYFKRNITKSNFYSFLTESFKTGYITVRHVEGFINLDLILYLADFLQKEIRVPVKLRPLNL